jgi:hypothetical protein
LIVRRLGLLLLALLSACSAAPALRAVEVMPNGVAYAYPDNEEDVAKRQATLYCANLGRGAALQGVKRDGNGARVAVFDCR